ncbi:MAG: NADH-quinone oxidoreductase subunit C [Methylococcaceae bacterium]|nr:NADH-quinone oxidoreductase subunit C [Methylococcaceae bacterium]
MKVKEQPRFNEETHSAPGGFEVFLKDLLPWASLGALGNGLAPAKTLEIAPGDWGGFAERIRRSGIRWVAEWAEDLKDKLRVNACFEHRGEYLVLRTRLEKEWPELPSQAPYFWAADRSERHIQDLYGIRFIDHPDPRRWIRHQAWPEDSYPLLKTFPAQGQPPAETPPDRDYPFIAAEGIGVYEVPVGPVHAGIIEPGHFRFQAVGETVLNLEERLGYVHKGIEKIAEGRDPEGLARLAGRISGDTTVAHTWATCLAMERAAGVEAPPRALHLRAIFCERERIINHIWDMAAICNDVSFAFPFYQFGRLREILMRENQTCFGHRLLMDRIVPGGVGSDLNSEKRDQMQQSIRELEKEIDPIITIVDFTESLEDRLVTTGILSADLATKLGALGYVGRASGQTFDVRRDAPYAPYDRLDVTVPLDQQGDVAARFWVRYKEVKASCALLRQLLESLPEGDLRTNWTAPAEGAEGLAFIEGWRGEILSYIRFAQDNKIDRFYPRDPSAINWPALEKLVMGNIVPDFPVCNKSVNGSYSGHDL